MDSLQQFVSSAYQWISALLVGLVGVLLRYIRPAPTPAEPDSQLEAEAQPQPQPQPQQIPKRPVPQEQPRTSNSLDKELQSKLAHRRGAMAEYTRPKYEVREW